MYSISADAKRGIVLRCSECSHEISIAIVKDSRNSSVLVCSQCKYRVSMNFGETPCGNESGRAVAKMWEHISQHLGSRKQSGSIACS
jgi:transcription elongation factor Elf1